jgi:hypothetical protein
MRRALAVCVFATVFALAGCAGHVRDRVDAQPAGNGNATQTQQQPAASTSTPTDGSTSSSASSLSTLDQINAQLAELDHRMSSLKDFGRHVDHLRQGGRSASREAECGCERDARGGFASANRDA